MTEFTSHSPEETETMAAEWASSLQLGSVVLLIGDLGAGKTCFSRGFLRGRGGNADDVSSPSFALVNEYPTPRGPVFHWDLYRLEPGIDWSVLDLEDHLSNASAITLIEWPEKHPDLNPESHTSVRIEAIDETLRKIHIQH